MEDDVVEIGSDGTFDLTSQPAAVPEPPKAEPVVESPAIPPAQSEDAPTKTPDEEEEDNSPPRKTLISTRNNHYFSCRKWRKD